MSRYPPPPPSAVTYPQVYPLNSTSTDAQLAAELQNAMNSNWTPQAGHQAYYSTVYVAGPPRCVCVWPRSASVAQICSLAFALKNVSEEETEGGMQVMSFARSKSRTGGEGGRYAHIDACCTRFRSWNASLLLRIVALVARGEGLAACFPVAAYGCIFCPSPRHRSIATSMVSICQCSSQTAAQSHLYSSPFVICPPLNINKSPKETRQAHTQLHMLWGEGAGRVLGKAVADLEIWGRQILARAMLPTSPPEMWQALGKADGGRRMSFDSLLNWGRLLEHKALLGYLALLEHNAFPSRWVSACLGQRMPVPRAHSHAPKHVMYIRAGPAPLSWNLDLHAHSACAGLVAVLQQALLQFSFSSPMFIILHRSQLAACVCVCARARSCT
eukprot:1161411-Pelagomonas_calceolata.AAC.9